MPISLDDIQPKSEKKHSADDGLPDKLLSEVPALHLLMQGSPPATYAPKGADFPELKLLEKHGKELAGAGFRAMPTADGKSIVFYNGLYLNPDKIKEAEKSGSLDKIAAPYAELRSAFEGAKNSSAPAGEAAPAAPAPPPSVTPESQPAPSVQKKLTTARIASLAPGAPTSGPLPGSGRILNSIVKPVV